MKKDDRKSIYRYTIGEDIANSISHGLGFIFSYIAMIVLIYLADNPLEVIGFSIYGIGMQLMFLSSTLYHAIFHDMTRTILKKIDHSMIFIFIFATYVPYTIFLGTNKAYIILAIVGISGILGIVLKVFLAGKFKKISTLIYVIVGWAAIMEIRDMYLVFPKESFYLLLAGGITYSIGAIVYALSKFKYHHFIWHIFVFVAAILQFYSIYILFR